MAPPEAAATRAGGRLAARALRGPLTLIAGPHGRTRPRHARSLRELTRSRRHRAAGSGRLRRQRTRTARRGDAATSVDTPVSQDPAAGTRGPTPVAGWRCPPGRHLRPPARAVAGIPGRSGGRGVEGRGTTRGAGCVGSGGVGVVGRSCSIRRRSVGGTMRPAVTDLAKGSGTAAAATGASASLICSRCTGASTIASATGATISATTDGGSTTGASSAGAGSAGSSCEMASVSAGATMAAGLAVFTRRGGGSATGLRARPASSRARPSCL